MAGANSVTATANASKNRMPTVGMGNVSNNSAINRNSVGGGGGGAGTGAAVDGASNKTFDAYPFLPPAPTQPLIAQNPLSPTHSPMRQQQQQSTMSNQTGAFSAAQQQHSPRSTYSLDRIAGTTSQSNNNQKLNQSNLTDQSSLQQQQHNSMLSPSRHLPFPYSNLNNYHRNF